MCIIQQLDIDISTWCNVTFFWVYVTHTKRKYIYESVSLRNGILLGFDMLKMKFLS